MTSPRAQAPTALASGVLRFPFGELSHPDFETLVRFLLEHELQQQDHGHRFTNVAQMPGVGDRGRDIILYRDDAVCGVVQCKRNKSRFTKRMLIKELVGFSMHALMDSSLIPNRHDFSYHLYVAGELSETAALLVHGYPAGIEAEIAGGAIAGAVTAHMRDYKTFRNFRDSYDLSDVSDVLRRLSVSVSTGCDLARRLHNAPDLISKVFRVQTVIDHSGAEVLLRQALTDFGLRQMNAADGGGSRKHIEKVKLDPGVVSSGSENQKKSLGFFAETCQRVHRGLKRPTPGPCSATIGYGLLRALASSLDIAAVSLSGIFFFAMMSGAMLFGIFGMIYLIPLAAFGVFIRVACRDHRRELRRHSRMPSPAAIATIDWGVPSALVIATTLACVICLAPI